MHYVTVCLGCGREQSGPSAIACSACGGSLGFRYDLDGLRWDERFAGSIWRFWRLLPVADPAAGVTLGEGGTPLLRSRLFGPDVTVHWKDESRNPTGSHKDRALAVAISHARSLGAARSVVVSAGSTGLSNAAYAARGGLGSVTLMARGAPEERIFPLVVLGSRLIEVDAGIDDIIEAARRLAARGEVYVSSTTRSSNPYQAEGAKTIAFEIVETLGEAPDWVVVPVGGGGSVGAVWRGFKELAAAGLASRLPRLAAVVPASYDALAAAVAQGIEDWETFAALPYRDDVATLLTKLSHAHPPDAMEALAAIRESAGTVLSFDDETAIEGSYRVAAGDGLYLEPSSGIVAPAIDRLVAEGIIPAGATVVAIACGSGFRETFAIRERRQLHRERVSLDALGSVLDGPMAAPMTAGARA